ncbi:MAG: hypothetical protein L0323_24095 [Planctomycetes bacterium]|nr:hypothetical protein [Planctomycetota bacterium]
MRGADWTHDSLSAVRVAPLLLLASCATAPARDAEVSAAPAPGGLRVRFRRLEGADPDRPPELRADGGVLDEIVFSPDLRAVSALWREPRGKLSCRFPYDGVAVFEAGRPVEPGTVEYVFLESEGVRVTAALPRGCLLLPALPFRLPPATRLLLPDGAALPDAILVLPRDGRGALRQGDLALTLETPNGLFEFLVGVDADGTPAAISGYVDPGSSRSDTRAPSGR